MFEADKLRMQAKLINSNSDDFLKPSEDLKEDINEAESQIEKKKMREERDQKI